MSQEIDPPIERVTHVRWPKPPTDYSRNVQERWDAIRPLYVLQRNRTATQSQSKAISR